MIEKPRYNLRIFKVHFGLLTLKAYTKGERFLRFAAIGHHTEQLGCGRTPNKFPYITARVSAMVDRFTGMLGCVEIGFLPDGILGQLSAPSKLGATPIGGVDLNRPRVRAALAAALALAVAPAGFTVGRVNMQTLLSHLGIATTATARSTTSCRSRPATLKRVAAAGSSNQRLQE